MIGFFVLVLVLLVGGLAVTLLSWTRPDGDE